MAVRKEIRNAQGHIEAIETCLEGKRLLGAPHLNKGGAFTREERETFHLAGCLPYRVETLEEQVEARYHQLQEKPNSLQKNIFLNVLNDNNETLFYRLVSEHLEELMPIIYTPTIGEAVERFSQELRRSRGMFLSYPDRDNMLQMLNNRRNKDVDVVVVTDGEGVLGIGDQGVGGMNIAIGKLMVYTLCAGINPNRVLPIFLDVGTDNHALLNDPQYLGWRHSRVTGKCYDDFIEQFTQALQQSMPGVYVHWEDFGRDNARRILEKYRTQFCTFNDDMQGTGMVAAANVRAASKVARMKMEDHRIVIFGAGTAGVGIADQLCRLIMKYGLSEAEAKRRFWLVDRPGLLLNNTKGIVDFQQPYLHSPEAVQDWEIKDPEFGITLYDVVKNVKPTVLIGCSAVTNAFNKAVVTEMAKHVDAPIIMPLSNPTSRCEADPTDLLNWTDGKVIMACGSPFPPVFYKAKQYRVAQGNNAFVYPGLGLGVIVAKAKMVTDEMLCAACKALSRCAPILQDRTAPLLPSFAEVREVSLKVARAVIEQAIDEGVAQIDPKADIDVLLNQTMWEPKYYPLIKQGACEID